LVHYSGPWTDEERTTIEHAILNAEAARLPRIPEGYGAPWIAVKSSGGLARHRDARVPVYIASRIGVDGMRRAQSAPGLATEIEAMAAGNPPKDARHNDS
jgi:hypothetical protein